MEKYRARSESWRIPGSNWGEHPIGADRVQPERVAPRDLIERGLKPLDERLGPVGNQRDARQVGTNPDATRGRMRPPDRRQTYAALSSALSSADTSSGRSGEHLATGRAGTCRARLVEPVLVAKQPGQPGRMGCYRACWIDEDPVLQYAPFSPHYVGLTPPRTSTTGDREPPPSLGSRLSAELAS